MSAFGAGELKDRIARFAGEEHVPRRVRVVEDTSDYFRVDYDDVVVLDGRPFFVRNFEREGRFGIDDEPKFWVRRALDLDDGSDAIIKMAFHERFTAHIGGIAFECVRSPKKEARILGLVENHPHFMQGREAHDPAGNPVRVIGFIHGTRYCDHVLTLGADHEDYFHNHFPAVLDEFIDLARGIAHLHANHERHGDIRRDHIIRERGTGVNRWIDFDFLCHHPENPWGYDLFGLGNVLAYLVGRGDVTVQELRARRPEVMERIGTDDLNIVFANRVGNLGKVYPYLPPVLLRVLGHFTAGATVFYELIQDLLDDLEEAREELQPVGEREHHHV
jgi:hypothetical protein